MKIIARGDRECGYIVSITGQEIANALGYSYESAEGCPHIEVGQSFSIAGAYMALHEIRQLGTELADLVKINARLGRVLAQTQPVLAATVKKAIECKTTKAS